MLEQPVDTSSRYNSKRLTLVVCIAVVGMVYFLAGRLADQSVNGQVTNPLPSATVILSRQEPQVGRDCMRGCHNAIVESFVSEVHGKSAKFLSDSRAANCEACHRNSEKHSETSSPTRSGGDVGNPAKLNASLANESCLQCHSRDRYLSNWRGGKHDRADMSCISCHTIHHTKFNTEITASRQRALQDRSFGMLDARGVDYMLTGLTVEETCFRCHSDKRKALYQRSTHLLRSENNLSKVTCVSCHNPHGGEGRQMLSEPSVNKVCYGCHAEKRGPFLWEHDPVQEDCLTCHMAHGSNFERLLTKRSHQLCQLCHINMLPRHSTVAGFDVFTFNRGCVNCHSQIHGSNHPSGRTFTR